MTLTTTQLVQKFPVFIAADIHNIPQGVPILSQINPVHILPHSSWRLIQSSSLST